MGLFSKKKKSNALDYPIMRMQIDMHSHILPEIDDGADSLKESLDMIKAFIQLGYTKIITTPHIHSGRYFNSRESIENAYETLIQGMQLAGLSLRVDYAAEYFVDNEFLKLLKQDDVISFGDEKYVLIEFPFRMPPVGFERVISMMKEKGLQPVLAHPERYEYWHGNAGMFEKIKSLGCLLQANIHSAGGMYGPIPQRIFQMLADNGWIDFLGSDAHNAKTIQNIDVSIQLPAVQSVILKGIRNHSL